jgi:hypothetical protein
MDTEGTNSMGKTQLVDIDLIRIDGGTQARVITNLDVVADYAEHYRDETPGGPTLPPVDVFWDGTDYWLGDGFHRRHAAAQAGLAKLDCVVHAGTKRDAILFAVQANHSHGLKRTNKDKRKAVEMLLADAEWSQQSDRWLADMAGVSNRFVGDLRAQLCTVHNSQTGGDRKGKDGKQYKATKPKAAKEAPENPRVVAVFEQREEACKAAEPLFPEVWAEQSAFDAVIQSLGRLASEVERLWKSPAGAFLAQRRNDVTAYFESLQQSLKFSAPHKVCPYCKGKGCKMQKGESTPCMGLGWTTRSVKGDGT